MTNNSENLFLKYKDDFEYCKNVIKNNSTSFYNAFKSLPLEDAYSIFAVYTFCRKIDDLADKNDDITTLEYFVTDFDEFLNGNIADSPMWRALYVVFQNYDMNIRAFRDMIHGQISDFQKIEIKTQNRLEDYCYYVAGTVGLMLSPIISDDPNAFNPYAIYLGKAMQLTNILRDIGEDDKNNRVYLPVEVMNSYNYSLDDLHNKLLNDNFINLWEYEAKIAEKYYKEFEDGEKYLKPIAKKSTIRSMMFYKEILNVVRKNNYDCFNKRNYISKSQKIYLFLRTL